MSHRLKRCLRAVRIFKKRQTPARRLLLWELSMEHLMEYTSDIPMLYAFVSTSRAAQALFGATPKRYLRMAMDSMCGVVKQLVVAIIAAHSVQPQHPIVMDAFLDTYLDGHGVDVQALGAIDHPLKVLRSLYGTYMAVETFCQLFAKSRISNLYWPPVDDSIPWSSYYNSPPVQWRGLSDLQAILRRWDSVLPVDGSWPDVIPLSDNESHRIKCALWRFQLYSLLFYPPGLKIVSGVATNGVSDQMQPLLIDHHCRYLNKFNPWELEELSTVHEYLVTYLEAYYEGPLNEQGTDQGEGPPINGPPITHDENATTESPPPLETPGTEEAARIQAEREHFRRRVQYQLSRGLPFLLNINSELTESGSNKHVDGFNLENRTLDVDLTDAIRHPDMICKTHGLSCRAGENLHGPGKRHKWCEPEGSPLEWPDKPHAHRPNHFWTLLLEIRHEASDLDNFYSSERVQLIRETGALFFDLLIQRPVYHYMRHRTDDDEWEDDGARSAHADCYHNESWIAKCICNYRGVMWKFKSSSICYIRCQYARRPAMLRWKKVHDPWIIEECSPEPLVWEAERIQQAEQAERDEIMRPVGVTFC